MTRSNTHSGSTILIVLLIVFTLPIWIGIAGGLFGLVMGLFGAAIGIIAGVFGAVIGAIAGVIGGVFGLFSWDWSPVFHFFGFHYNFLLVICLVIAIVMVSRSRRK